MHRRPIMQMLIPAALACLFGAGLLLAFMLVTSIWASTHTACNLAGAIPRHFFAVRIHFHKHILETHTNATDWNC